MNIEIKLDRDFERFVETMKDKYGEHMLELNGLSEHQLNHTEFIDYFVDKNKNTADTSIDANANVGHKDVTTLENEMMKPHLKLLAYNKIFLDFKQKYGLRAAKKWAEDEWSGAFYLHDFYSTSLKSYCIFPQECCTFILEGKKLYASLEDLYKLLPEEEHFDAQQNVYYKEPKNLAVLDYDTKLNQKRYTKVYLVSHKETDKDLYFNKLYNGANLITTEDHSYITTAGEVAAKNLLEDETICYSIYDSDIFTNSMSSYAGLELTPDLGYLVGMYLAEGFDSRGQMFICQDYEHSKAYFEKIKTTLEKLDIPYKYNETRKVFSLTNGNFNWEKKLKKIILGHYAHQKHLCPDFIHFNFDFLKGVLAGIIDGDGNISQNKVCMIRMTSRTLINQIRAIGLANNVYFSSRLPYIQSKAQKAKIISKYPVYSANVNMNRNSEFFLSLPSIKVKTQFTDFNFNEEFANKNYLLTFGELKVRDNTKTYKPSATVYDLSTQSHTFICNDILVHNCFAYDLAPIVEKGLFFVNNFNSLPPKHLTTYTDFVGEAVSWLSNRTSGAVGLPNFLVYSYYFWKKDCKEGYYIISPEYYRDQEFQRIIYKLNQPYLRVTQSAFTNFSIFDRSYIMSLFGGLVFPDGTLMIDEVEDFIEYEKAFMEKVSEVRSQNVMTFPVLTYALLRVNNKFEDEDFAKWCCEHNMKWADSNFFISRDVTSLSNCPLKGSTKILYWSDRYSQFVCSPIKEAYNNLAKMDKDYIEVLQNGKKVKCRINKFNKSANYEIELVNGAKITTTADHLNKVFGRDYVRTDELTIDDYLPISLHPYEETNNLTYEEGKLVGMFLGDGSYSKASSVVFSLNTITDADDIEFINSYCPKHFDAKISSSKSVSSLTGNDYCANIVVNSAYLRGLIQKFVAGNSALNKKINLRALSCSKEFRQGILDGLYTTDGSKNLGGGSNRLYTSSEDLKDTLVLLCASLGIATTVSKDEREGRLGSNPNYTIRFYTPNGRMQRKDVYKVDDDYFWFKIKSITKAKTKATDVAYCLEIIDKDAIPEFMLGNGIITHNCRLISNIDNLGYFNSIGGSALEVGSVKVNTINLARIAYETKDKKKYIEKLKDRVITCIKALDIVRDIITKNIERGLLPNYSLDLIHLKSQYNTIGINALWEAVKYLGGTTVDEFGKAKYTEEGQAFAENILHTIIETKDQYIKDNGLTYQINCEQVPAERCATILQEKDKELYDDGCYELPLYGNQWIPLGVKTSLLNKLSCSSELDKACSGGSIAHINLESPFTNFDTAWDTLNKVADLEVPYFAFCTKISACEQNHGFYGETCPICGKPKVTSYQRIVGFLTPEINYSKERKAEFRKRDWFTLSQIEEI